MTEVLAHEVAGSGPPRAAGWGPALLLVHAGIADRRMWDDQMGPFADAGWTVIRADLPGFGQTPTPDRARRPVGDPARPARLPGGGPGGGRRRVAGWPGRGRPRPGRPRTGPGPWSWPGRGWPGTGSRSRPCSSCGTRARAPWSAATTRRRPGWRSTPGSSAWAGTPRRSTPRSAGGSGTCCWWPTSTARPTWRSPTHRPPAASARSPPRPWSSSASTTAPTSTPWPTPWLAASPGPERALLGGTAHLPNMEQPEEFNRVVLAFLAEVDGA